MSEPLPLLAASERLRGHPGRPRTPRPEPPLDEPARAAARRLLDVEGAATYLSVSVWTIRDYFAAGVLPRVVLPGPRGKDLRRLLVDVADLDALIARSKETSA